MKGVIYARYSSDSQREESIEGQIRDCKSYAERNDIDIVEIYIDRAYTATNDNRPDFQRMIHDSVRKKFEAILVWKLDRFARRRYDSAHYKNLLKKNGVKVVSVMEPILEGSEGILIETLLEGMAEFYSADLSEKVMRGQTENALKCMYNGGTLPIGYVIDKEQHYQIDPVAAPMILQAFTDYANGKSMREVANGLNLAGVRTKRGGKVSINSVTRMLHNRKYIGEYQYRDIVHPHGIPAIVPKELFERVQERLAKTKKAPAKFKAEDEYLLTTKLFCGKCNCYMAGESGTSHTGIVHRYYKCVSVKNHKGCDKKPVQKEWIENLVIDQIKKILFDDEMIEKLADMGMERQRKENTALPMLKRQLAETEKDIRNFVDAIQQGIITESTKERLEGLEKAKRELSAQIAREELLQPPEFTRDQFLFWFERMRKYDTTKLVHRRRLIDSFVNAIYLYDNRITLVFNFKDGTKTITFAELEESGLGSDINALAAPKTPVSGNNLPDTGTFFISSSRLFPRLFSLLLRRSFLRASFHTLPGSVHKR
jgi:DNA invertase Pin-like site-specific DNA recombinase